MKNIYDTVIVGSGSAGSILANRLSNDSNRNILLSSRNLKNSRVVLASELNTYDVMNANKLMFTESSVSEIEKIFNN